MPTKPSTTPPAPDPLEAATAQADALAEQARAARQKAENLNATIAAAEDQAEAKHWQDRRLGFAAFRAAADTSGKWQAFRSAVLADEPYVGAYLDWQTAQTSVATELAQINAWLTDGQRVSDYGLSDGQEPGDSLRRRLSMAEHVERVVRAELDARTQNLQTQLATQHHADREQARAAALAALATS